jgi:uncharacterized SAM-binding protein YcdF (DUF218 family)
MQRKKMAIIIAPVVLLGATLFLIHEPVISAVGDFLVIHEALQPADVIHVIAGPDHRTYFGIRLYQKGYGKQLFFTGGWCDLYNGYHGQIARQLAVKQGISIERIGVDDSKVTSRYSEAVRLKKFIDQSQVPIRSVIVVSDPYHMRRACWAYRQVLGDQVSLQMAPVPFELSPYQRRWWMDEKSRQYVKNEYRKLVYYYARYRLSWGPVRDWLASLDRD